jgi:hypothetical protein
MPSIMSFGVRRRFAAMAGTLTLLLVSFLLVLVFSALRAVADPPARDQEKELSFKRRDASSAEQLASELLNVPEIDLFLTEQAQGLRDAAADLAGELRAQASYAAATGSRSRSRGQVMTGGGNLPALSARLTEEQTKACVSLGLPVPTRTEVLLTKDAATALEETSSRLRSKRLVTLPLGGSRGAVDPPKGVSMTHLKSALSLGAAAEVPAKHVPALVQMLQVEKEASRLLLIEALTRMEGEKAGIALAQRALYDPAFDVREAAVRALADRPREQYRQVLVDGLRHPWPRVADHAAEALVALRDYEALPAVQKLTVKPDPSAAFMLPGSSKKALVREMVRINHLRNCLMCHAPADDSEAKVLAPVPEPGQPLVAAYYDSRDSRGTTLLVRADVTYLRQDFSLMQPVHKAAPWPEKQRFDFLVRTREATIKELEAAKNPPAIYPQREAALWAIAELQPSDAAKPMK